MTASEPTSSLRDTSYATELGHAAVREGDSEVRIERLRMKANGQEEVRFSWWKEGRLVPRPLDLPEAQLLELMRQAARDQVLSPCFVTMLRAALAPFDASK